MPPIEQVTAVGRLGEIVNDPAEEPRPHPSDDPAAWDPLVIEVENLYGEMEAVEWLGPDVEVDVVVNDLPRARLPVVHHDGYLVNVGSAGVPIAIALETALPDDRLVVIRTGRESPEQDVTIFRGYVESIQRSATAAKETTVELIHLADDLRRDVTRTIHGQFWLRLADEAEYAEMPATNLYPRICTGLPAVFNPDGQRNCRRRLTYALDPLFPDAHGAEGAHLPVPLFAHGLDPDRQAWTWARVFLFWMYWQRRLPDGTLGMMPHDMFDRNLVAKIIEHDWHKEDPDNLSIDALAAIESGDAWAKALLAKPASLALEGMDGIAALQWICARSGLIFAIDTITDADTGQPREGFRFSVPGGGRIVDLKMPSKHFRTDNVSWTEVRRNADVQGLTIVQNYGQCVNAVMGAGGARHCEVTVELRPGWEYDAGRDPQVDVNPTDANAVAAAIARIGSDEWWERYSTVGGLYLANWNVLRTWIACDYQDLHDSAYARPFAPWLGNMYYPLDLVDLRIGEVLDTPGMSALRPRPMMRCLTGPQPGSTHEPIVQISTQGGAAGTWYQLPAAPKISKDRLAVHIGIVDLASDTLASPFDPDRRTLPEAYMRGLLRVRITGVIETDLDYNDGLYALYSTADSLSRRRRGRLLYRPNDFREALRDDHDGYPGGNSFFRDTLYPADEILLRDELREVTKYLRMSDRLRVTGPLAMPGMVLVEERDDVISGYRPGDEVRAIIAEDGRHEHDLDLRSRDGDDHAIVANVNYRWAPGDGKLKSPAAVTTLTLEDAAALVRMGGAQRMQRVAIWIPSDELAAGETVQVYGPDGAGGADLVAGVGGGRIMPVALRDGEHHEPGVTNGPWQLGAFGNERRMTRVLSRELPTGLHAFAARAFDRETGAAASNPTATASIYINTAPRRARSVRSAETPVGGRLTFSYGILQE